MTTFGSVKGLEADLERQWKNEAFVCSGIKGSSKLRTAQLLFLRSLLYFRRDEKTTDLLNHVIDQVGTTLEALEAMVPYYSTYYTMWLGFHGAQMLVDPFYREPESSSWIDESNPLQVPGESIDYLADRSQRAGIENPLVFRGIESSMLWKFPAVIALNQFWTCQQSWSSKEGNGGFYLFKFHFGNKEQFINGQALSYNSTPQGMQWKLHSAMNNGRAYRLMLTDEGAVEWFDQKGIPGNFEEESKVIPANIRVNLTVAVKGPR